MTGTTLQYCAEHSTVLGTENVAVTSAGTFRSGGFLNHCRRKYERIRGNLQQTGTGSAHRTLERLCDCETRWAEDYLHHISNMVVQEVLTHGCDTISFE